MNLVTTSNAASARKTSMKPSMVKVIGLGFTVDVTVLVFGEINK